MRAPTMRATARWTPRAAAALLTTALLAAALPAQAGRPLQTDDAGVLGPGECELELASARAREPELRAREFAVQAGCHAGALGQLALGLSRARAEAGGESARASGVELNGKLPIVAPRDEAGAAWSLGWSLQWARAAGERRRHAASGVTLVTTAPLGPDWSLHANLGHERDEIGRQRSTVWGFALEHAGLGPGAALAPMAELFGDDRGAPWWNLGLRLALQPERLFVDVSWGRQITGGRPQLLTLGAKLAF